MNTAETILNQIGGNKFLAMTGSKNLLNVGNGLKMNLTRNASGAQYLKIVLNSTDTYDMTFYSAKTVNFDIVIKVKKEITNVYADQLANIFESTTGLFVKF